ncbi:hypothetical protein VTN00DRAFT_511 [Thermoascus crustaceus]|uniref:uncharacterized protein n=1 Tax=Thermoascus crustaceus TaxID=5088 RepID=UPI0037420DA7
MALRTAKEIVLPAQDEYQPEVKLLVGPKPLKEPTADSKHILIIGGGVSGLMTSGLSLSWEFIRTGYQVKVPTYLT